MKPFPLNCSEHLSDLTKEIKTAKPDRASEIVYRVGHLLVFAGYGAAAYEALSYLSSGTLQLNPYLDGAVRSYNSLVLSLCNALCIESPELSEYPSMSVVELSKVVHLQEKRYKASFLFQNERGVAAYLCSEKLACIQAKSDDAKNSIIKWWRTEDRSFHSIYDLVTCIPIVCALLSGALQNDIQITQEQVSEFIASIRNYQYTPQPLFIPSPSDWSDLLKKWNDKMFLDLSESDLETYVDWYPDEFIKEDCTKPPATETDIQSLEQRLGKRLPPSYRNFLLASNGWTLMETFTELFNTQDVDWLKNLTPWLADWEGSDISDEEYFDYSDLRYYSGIRSGHMESVLQISNCEDGYVYLLNPLIVDERGEWECFDFGTKVLGGHRYRSFWDMIHKFYLDQTD